MSEVLGLMGFWICLFGYVVLLIFVIPWIISKVADALTGKIEVRNVTWSAEEGEELFGLGKVKTGKTMKPIRRAARRGISRGDVMPMRRVTKVKRRK